MKLESVPEIITKKIFYRGGSIRARDIFDIAAAAQDNRDEIVKALCEYPNQVAAALAQLGKLNPEFIDRAISELAISEQFRDLAGSSRQRTMEILEDAHTA